MDLKALLFLLNAIRSASFNNHLKNVDNEDMTRNHYVLCLALFHAIETLERATSSPTAFDDCVTEFLIGKAKG